MYQRKSSYIISAKGLRALLAGLYSEESPYPTEVADRLNLSMPNGLSAGASFRARKIIEGMDKSVPVLLAAFHADRSTLLGTSLKD